MEIKTSMHTVFLLVGPSNCGKSTFAKKMSESLNSQLENSCSIISSDEIRRWLLNDPNKDKYDSEMMQVSKQAFNLYSQKLQSLMSYPVSRPFIILDSTGLNEEYRNEMVQLTKKYHYNIEMILFNYKKRQDFFFQEDVNQRVINNHIKKLHKEVLPNLGRKNFKYIHKITQPENEVSTDISNLKEYQSCLLPDGIKYHIVGDIHGCLDELLSLLSKLNLIDDKNNFIVDPQTHQVVLVGDLIDKGPKSKEVLNFVHKNLKFFKIVLGNHENFVSKFLKKQIKNDFKEGFLESNFSTALTFSKEDESLLDSIIKESKPFLKAKNFIATHAPCKNIYLGKIDSKSKQKQRNFFFEKKEEDFDNENDYISYRESCLSFLKEDSSYNFPFHFFGHVAMSHILNLENKRGIDTGAVHGNYLTCAIPSYKVNFIKVKSENYYNKKLLSLFQKNKTVNFSELDERELKRIDYSIKDKISYVSGTIAPADKNEETNELESLDQAFDYYKKHGQTKVILETKYMGSRGTVYLDVKNPDKSFCTSRNGFKIKKVDLSSIYTSLSERLKSYIKKKKISKIIIDGELMPWSLLGKGLIENEFISVGQDLASELSLLKETGFEEAFNQELSRFELDREEFKKDFSSLSGKALDKKYGTQKYQNNKALLFLDWISLSEQEKLIQVFNEQVNLFGNPDIPTHFKPFSILKEIYEDGSEYVFINEDQDTEEMFKLISDDPYIVVDLNNPDSIQKGKDFYSKTTLEDKNEGVVVKPMKTYTPSIAPFIKVRNPQYLSIIYGFDYTHPNKYSKLLKKKRINKKLKLSIKEFELGKKLLEIPEKDISSDNSLYKNILAKLILEEKKEKELDPKL